MSKLVRLIVTSDTHAHWLNRPDNANQSLVNTAGVIAGLQAKEADLTLTIDLGDFIQGSSFATYLNEEVKSGVVLARAMNALNYDYQLIGNHEFNFGQNYRDQILQEINAKILLSNIINDETGKPFIGKPFDIIEQDGLKIGIVGVTTSYIPHWELPKHYEGLSFDNAFESAKHYVDLIRPQVDLVILAYHGGFERDIDTGRALEELTKENQAYEMLVGIDGVDVLLTGHQHRHLNQLAGQTWIIQPGYAGEYVGEIEIQMADKMVVNMQGQLHQTLEEVKRDDLIEIMEPEISQGQAWLNHVIGQAPLEQVTESEFEARMFGHPYIEFINQIQLEETGADFSAVALINDAFKAFHGPISHEVLLKSYPYYNLIAKVNVTGEDLYHIMSYNFEYYSLDEESQLVINPEYIDPKPRHYNFDLYSGIQTTVDMTRPLGQRIVKIIDERTGQAIDRDQVYSLAVSQYRAVGGGDFVWFNQSKIESISQIDIASLMIEALGHYDEEKWQYINDNYRHIVWQDSIKYGKNK